MKNTFFQKQFEFYMYIFLIVASPIFIYWRDAWWPDTINSFSISAYLQKAIFGVIFFSVGALLLGIENRINVNQNGISLKRFGHVITSIAWEELGKVYRKQERSGSVIIFESLDGSKNIPINLRTSKNTKIIYDSCPNQKIKDMIKELKIMD